MKKIYLFLFSMLFLTSFGWGQTNLWTEDFETDGDGGTRYQSSNSFNDGTNDHFQRTDGTDISGTYNSPNNSFFWAGEDLDDNGGDGNSVKTILFNSIDISGYTDLEFSGLFASGNAGSGWDSSDELYIEYSLDGGAFTKFMQFSAPSSGSNVGLNFDPNIDGTGEGAAITTTFVEYSKTLGITGNTIQFRLYANANSASEEFGFDFFKLNGIAAGGGNDTDAEAYNTGSQPAGASISSLDDTYAERVDVFNMYIGEAGTADGLPTHVTNVRIKPHSSNTADWTDHIQGAVLNDGSSDITATVDITDIYIDFAIASGDLDIADGDFEELTLSIYLNTSGIVENSVLSFTIDADDHGFTADASGTGFMSTFNGGDFNSNDFTVDVEATQLSFLVQPSNVNVDAVMSPDVEVAFTDSNGNVDVDYDGGGFGISLSTTGTFDGTATTLVDASSGVAVFDNLLFSTSGSGLTLTASDDDGWGFSDVDSDGFDVIEAPKVFFSQVTDPNDNANAKYVEIYNAGNSSVDLTGWSIRRYANGSTTPATVSLPSSISAGYAVVVCYSTSNFLSAFGFNANTNDGDLTGNGNDVYELYDGSSTVDIYGEIGVDGTGQDWEYTNSMAVRKSSVTNANSTWTSSEWTITSSADVVDMSPGTYRDHFTWNGATDEAWTTNGNWSGGTAPDATKNIRIPSGPVNFPTISNETVTCNDLTIVTDGYFDVATDGNLTINGDFTNGAGTLTIESDATGDGSVIVEGGMIGAMVVERYIPAYSGADDGWHLLSSPRTATFDLATSDFVPTEGNDDVYNWNEVSYEWENYFGTANPDFDFEPGYGYLVAYKTAPTPVREFSGYMNNQDFSIGSLTNTDNNADDAFDGWHLLGNPYTSALKWNDGNWSLSGINATAKIYNEGGGNYIDVAPNGYIPMSQGFFVQVSTAPGSLTIPLASREHNATGWYKSDVNMQELKLKISGGSNSFYDYASVKFNATATEGFDSDFDSYKMYGMATAPQLMTKLDLNEMVSTNVLPFSNDERIVPLNFKAGTNGQFTINVEENTVMSEGNTYLEDLLTGQMINLDQQSSYTFQAATNDDENRFLLHFNGVTGLEDVASESNIQVYSVDDMIYINSSENLSADILVYNINGQLLYQDVMRGETLKSIQWEASSGIYLVSVVSEETTTTEKVYIK
jgi:hypothetical protein